MASIINASSTGSGGIVQTADASGVLQLQSNGTTALTVATSANVGIGEASPTSKLIVNSGANTTIAGFYSTGSSAFLGMANSGATTFIGNDSTSGSFVVQTPGSSFATKLTVSPVGYVTTPYQPAFQINGDTLNGLVYTGGAVNLNTGSHFNTSTGIFTAPVAGNYLFSFALTIGDANSQFVNIYKNGVLFAGNILQYTTTFTTGSQTLIIPMSVSDTVNAQVRDASYSIYNARFCGYLLG